MVSTACALIFEAVFTQGVESEVDVATALTRARLARLPSPCPEAVDFLDLAARASKKVEHWRAWLCGKQRKSTASILEEGRGAGASVPRHFFLLWWPPPSLSASDSVRCISCTASCNPSVSAHASSRPGVHQAASI